MKKKEENIIFLPNLIVKINVKKYSGAVDQPPSTLCNLALIFDKFIGSVIEFSQAFIPIEIGVSRKFFNLD